MNRLIKTSILLPLFMPLMGCSHIRIVGFDKSSNTVLVQGGKFASESAIQQKAEEYCGGQATLLSMGEKTVGVLSTANFQTYGSGGHGSATTVGITRYVYNYRCEGNRSMSSVPEQDQQNVEKKNSLPSGPQ